MSTPSGRARAVFIAREAELAWLLRAYEAVRAGGGPHVLVLHGEPGVGKTRLMQQFFHELSTRHDGTGETGFWTDELGATGECLRVNPDLPALANDAPMPFLWSGIRFSDPGERNSPGSDEFSGWQKHIGYLGILLIASAKKQQGVLKASFGDLKAKARQYRKEPAAMIEGVLSEALGQAGLPLAGPITSALTKLIGFATQRDVTSQISQDQATRRSGDDEVILFKYMYSDLHAVGIPAVLFVDDAQWGDTDFALMLGRLLDEAQSCKWPLLVVATCWPKPWKEALAIKGKLPSVPDERLAWVEKPGVGLLGVLVSNAAEPRELRRLAAPAQDPLEPVLAAAFPGMHKQHCDILLRAAEGNPQHLRLLIAEIERKATWFEGRDTKGPLNASVQTEGRRVPIEQALTHLAKMELAQLVRYQIEEAEPEVKLSVAFGSHIGHVFPAELAIRFARKHEQSLDAHGIHRACHPYSFIEARNEAEQGNIFEFVAKIYQVAANEVLRDAYVDDEVALDHTLGITLQEWIEHDEVWNDLSEDLQSVAVRIAVSRQDCGRWIDPVQLIERVSAVADRLTRQNRVVAAAKLYEAANWLDARARSQLDEVSAEVERDAEVQGTAYDVVFGYASMSFDVSTATLPFDPLESARDDVVVHWRALLAKLGKYANPFQRDGLAKVLTNRGLALRLLWRADEALCAYDEAIALRRALLAELGEKAEPDLHNSLANTLMLQGGTLRFLDRAEEALVSYDEAIALRRALLADIGDASLADLDEQAPDLYDNLASSIENRGIILHLLDRTEEAVLAYAEAIALRRALLTELESKATPEHHDSLANTLMLQGGTLSSLDRAEEAVLAYDEAITLRRGLLTKLGEKATPDLRHGLATALTDCGVALLSLGQVERALLAYDKAIVVGRALLAERGTLATPSQRGGLALVLTKRGDALSSLNRAEEAVLAYGEAIALRRALLAELESKAALDLCASLANALMLQGGALSFLNRAEEAVLAYDEAITLQRRLLVELGEKATADVGGELARAVNDRGYALQSLNRVDEAVSAYVEAIALLRSLLAEHGENATPDLRRGLATALNNRSHALGSLGRVEEAVVAWDEAIIVSRALIAQLGDQATPDLRDGLAVVLTNRGNALFFLNRAEEAVLAYDEAITLRRGLLAELGEKAPADSCDELAKALNNRAIVLQSLGRMEEAVLAHDEGIALRRALLGKLGEEATLELRQGLATALNDRGVALRSLDRLEEAVRTFEEAIAMQRALLAELGEKATPDLRDGLARMLKNRRNATGFRAVGLRNLRHKLKKFFSARS